MARATPVHSNEPPPKPAPQQSIIDVSPSPDAARALALSRTTITVIDKASHQETLEWIRGAKRVKRAIEEHWQKITRSVDDLKRTLLDLKRKDLEPVETKIAEAEREALAYEDIEKRRAQAEQDRLRREAEERARVDREKQIAEQEARALQVEAESPSLSPREQVFVEALVAGRTGAAAAQRAGYRDPVAAADRLQNMMKIQQAIGAKQEAMALREQAAATRQQPLDVKTEKMQAQLGHAAGVSSRTYYSCNPAIDYPTLLAGVIAGKVPSPALMPNLVELNRAAGDLKEAFETAYPGCRLVKRSGIAG